MGGVRADTLVSTFKGETDTVGGEMGAAENFDIGRVEAGL